MEQHEEDRLPSGYAGSEEERERRIIRIGRREVLLFLGGAVVVIAIGSYSWHAFKFYFQDRKYRSVADKAVEGIQAATKLAEKIEDTGIAA